MEQTNITQETLQFIISMLDRIIDCPNCPGCKIDAIKVLEKLRK